MRRRYEALPPLPEFPWEREWVDRLRSFDDFLRLGPLVWESFSLVSRRDHERMRQLAPELYELLRDSFGG